MQFKPFNNTLPINKLPVNRLFLNLGLSFLNGFILSILLTVHGRAIAFTYDETIDGDLSQFPRDTLFELEPGENKFTGEITFSFSEAGDADAFTFNIPENALLTSVAVQVIPLSRGSGEFNAAGFNLFQLVDGNLNNLAHETLNLPVRDRSLFVSVLPLPAGTYSLFNSSRGGLAAPDGSLTRTAAYTFSLQVDVEPTPSAIPEAGMIWGLTVALGGWGYLRGGRRTD
jgi:hypothetical protein